MSQLLLFITAHPREANFSKALAYAQEYLLTHNTLTVFFYSDAAYIANAYNWQPANEPNLQQDWQTLAAAHGIILNVCVSTALSRGITNVENSKRHQIFAQQPSPQNSANLVYADNLAAGFELVGLGTLAELMHQADSLMQF